MADVSTSDAATRLGRSSRWVTALLKRGDLTGRQLADGTWLVNSDSLSSYRRTRASGAGRAWTAETSWALLGELSGKHLVDVSDSTASRVRRRIREHSAEDIARLVSTRTKWRRFIADDSRTLADDIVLTGRSAAEKVDDNLAEQRAVTQGYVLADHFTDWVKTHLVIADAEGSVVIGTYPATVHLDADSAPEAAIAADLAQSASTRERSAGLGALERMRQEWLAQHTK